MKNKSVTYILSVLVLIIWGTIFYKIFFQTECDSDTASVSFTDKVPFFEAETDTFSVSMNYPDPFLKGKSSNSKKVAMTSNQRSIVNPIRSSVTPPTKKALSWPSIMFSGVIRKNADVIAIVNISGNTQLVKKADIINDIIFSHITEDSIIVSFQKENKIIKKQ